eukprot:scaffold22592_cov23-Phaeocystis_antarctica.AAC.1
MFSEILARVGAFVRAFAPSEALDAAAAAAQETNLQLLAAALRWITQTCVAFDGLCCVASTILAAPERPDTCAAPVAENAPSSKGGSAPVHTDAPWEPAAPEEQPASMDMSGGDSGCVQPGGSLLDLLLQCDITLPRSVLRHEGRQEAPRGCVSLKQEPFRRTASGRHA